ncbi:MULTISPECIES: glutaredoxin family protein [Tsukamurella]|uniref:Glutaredoxin family protein n=2 Tax=Tsukamurella TaxID=2060 RepID=A0A5C5S6A4_9ACTN|nr:MULTISPECIES: glutaredoxin family protein [Tsukamurella]NMD56952.1 glutaredoxin family protein [Tsukamurella columbiensis]TWS29851.1 glutaredoxin family protein [Tsukamurella conjunctivitidis]
MAVITLLTREGCGMCARAHDQLTELVDELRAADRPVDYRQLDVDAPGNTELRGEYGDMLPVVLLDGEQHSYWEADIPQLRADILG